MWMSMLSKNTEKKRKTPKNNPLKTKRILNIKMPAKGGPVFTFRLAPLSVTPLSILESESFLQHLQTFD